ncbi:quinolinate synthase NadA [Deinococcus cellulosilyticus]|uniref:Quinolinate synthase n=1 Tax=Deinococcus cellulosilyticus (strain DSM 18568 / NBRC 106333 / KACC 11606 / 5516J-15) TaxID=1223518 RepID=A0A511N537_DEIC1|nr:quinolinate synthase NadA [Deinococcus cellulosilyticus]GEM47962.1 quinolinate synthase A [Deinococcus cellulosilyticus NBRC 106333 = KACC 11606]
MNLIQLEPYRTTDELKAEIQRLKTEKKAVVLAHNYQRPEVQEIADFVGDSLGLARQAARTEAEVIVFAGVHFMAETAAILNPEKKVLLPNLNAGCSLADTITADDVRAWKQDNPDGLVVVYVNTTADVKAEADYCVTSGNAVAVVNSLPKDRKIFFAPDMFLAAHVERQTGRKLDIWLGECHVHAGIRPDDIDAQKAENPGAEFLIHPECGCASHAIYNFPDTPLLSTEAMISHSRQSEAKDFIVVTEIDMVHRLRREVPGKNFIPVNRTALCEYMKMISLENVYETLRDLNNQVTVPQEVAEKALTSIERMIQIG